MTEGYQEDINHSFPGSNITVRALTEAIGRLGTHSGFRNGLSAQKYFYYLFIEEMFT
jgi:hypothetical protein